ncbi:MAG: hypothetical protein EHM12_03970 [Dehalococcoidia bacterium]|nr:MAG: hypothetical protein EHM12_03970 [Dehalococcoidia bacterium]
MIDADNLKQKLVEAGLVVKAIEVEPQLMHARPDFVVHADFDGREIRLVIESKERSHLAELRLAVDQGRRYTGPNRIPMIAAQYLGPNRRSLLREMKMGYFDMAGNIYLRAPGVFIERDGKPRPAGYPQPKFNPYSDKASIMLRLLMDEPGHPWRIREIAEAGGITAGWASLTVDSMVERGIVQYSRDNGIRLLAWEDTLKEWADFYDWQKSKFHYYYCHALDMQEILEKISKLSSNVSAKCALGFQAGAHLITPYSTFNQVHLLIEGNGFDLMKGKIEQELSLEARKEGSNLILIKPYYTNSALFRARKIKKWRVVSDIQLYLDLNRYPLRGHEQAEQLLEKVIRPRMGRPPKGKHGS